MKGKIMKLRTIFYGLTSGLLLGLSSCSLNYEPLDTYSDVTEGVTSDGTKIVFKDKAAVESHLTTLYNQMRDRQEHWYVDLLLISDSHSDNAYAGTTGRKLSRLRTIPSKVPTLCSNVTGTVIWRMWPVPINSFVILTW